MKSILVELTCPTCMYHTYRKSETLILSDFETQAREELLQDTFFTLHCPRCGRTIAFLHPLAYVDKQHSFILLIKAEKDFHPKDHHLYAEDTKSRKRFLCDHTKIAETMRILEDDLDDRAIEIIKYKLYRYCQQRHPKLLSVRYLDIDPATQTIWFDLVMKQQNEHIAILKEEYDKVLQKLTKESCDQYLKIDEAWAKAWMKRQ